MPLSTLALYRMYGCRLILFLTIASATSSPEICWPSVHLQYSTDRLSQSRPKAWNVSDPRGGTPAALWFRGLPCTRDGSCCSKRVVLHQGTGIPCTAGVEGRLKRAPAAYNDPHYVNRKLMWLCRPARGASADCKAWIGAH